MDDLGPFLTVAEVSVAFAGFASLVTAVASRSTESWNEGNFTRFFAMITASLYSLFFSLIPFAALYFEVMPRNVWLYCGGLLSVYAFTSFLYILTPRYRELAAAGEISYVYTALTNIPMAAVVIVQILAFAGLVEPTAGTYFLGVLVLLFQAAVSFARLLSLTVFPQDRRDT